MQDQRGRRGAQMNTLPANYRLSYGRQEMGKHKRKKCELSNIQYPIFNNEYPTSMIRAFSR